MRFSTILYIDCPLEYASCEMPVFYTFLNIELLYKFVVVFIMETN